MNPYVLGFLRALGFALLTALLNFLANVTNLNGIVTPGVAAIIAALALSLEHGIASKTGSALFGAVKL